MYSHTKCKNPYNLRVKQKFLHKKKKKSPQSRLNMWPNQENHVPPSPFSLFPLPPAHTSAAPLQLLLSKDDNSTRRAQLRLGRGWVAMFKDGDGDVDKILSPKVGGTAIGKHYPPHPRPCPRLRYIYIYLYMIYIFIHIYNVIKYYF